MIISTEQGDAATVLYAKEGYDITKEVLKELNDTL